MPKGANDIPETLSRLQPALDAFTSAIEGGRPEAIQAAADRLHGALADAAGSAWPDDAPGPRGLRRIPSASLPTVTSRT
jgi:DNA-binding GntR family transcriptional regulator